MADLTVHITCPACGHTASETMPLDRCVFFYECAGCGVLLKPKAGDCCVYCSYGDKRCPPIQDDRPCPDKPRANPASGQNQT
jgi:hypothetical protein